MPPRPRVARLMGMKNELRAVAGAAVVALLVSLFYAPNAPAQCRAEYDAKKPFEMKGTITKVDWMNPHVYFYIDVKDESGKTLALFRCTQLLLY